MFYYKLYKLTKNSTTKVKIAFGMFKTMVRTVRVTFMSQEENLIQGISRICPHGFRFKWEMSSVPN